MGLSNLKLGSRLNASFVLVILIFVGVIGYQLYSILTLGQVQNEYAGRSGDSLTIDAIQLRTEGIYGVIADAIINRDMKVAKEGLDAAKKALNEDIKTILGLVDTGKEQTWAKEFEGAAKEYVNLFETKTLPILLKEESLEGRMRDSLACDAIALRLERVYPVVADAVINRNLEETKADWIKIKETAGKDIAVVAKLVDTDKEKALAREFGESYKTYLNLFESQLLPSLGAIAETDWAKVRDLDEKIDQARSRALTKLAAIQASIEKETTDVIKDEAEIRRLDGEIDAARQLALARLTSIRQSLAKETKEAADDFRSISSRTEMLAMILGAIGVIVALILSWLLTRSITGPLNRIIADLSAGSDHIGSASTQVSSASVQLAEGASEQAASLEETSSSLEEMTSMTQSSADNAAQANTLMVETGRIVDQAGLDMKQMAEAMDQIAQSGAEISKIVKSIDEIAFQTNLLALNAAVEAARAGEAGAGFAVVADEVRNLAMRAAEAARTTQTLIEGTVDRINQGSELVVKTQEGFGSIAESSKKVAGLVGEVASASAEQAQGIDQINQAMTQMDQVVQGSAANAEESASASQELKSLAGRLQDMVAELRGMVGGGKSVPARNESDKSDAYRESRTRRTPRALAAPKRTKKKNEVKPEEVIPLDDDLAEF